MARITAKIFLPVLIAVAAVLSACTGLSTFHDHARAGDTIAVAAGRAHHLQRGNFEVTITDAAGSPTTYTPGAPEYAAVKASVNMYPDPVSSLVLSERVGTDLTPGARTYSSAINFTTGDDVDWWETVIFVDLPDPMALGDATIEIKDINVPANETVTSIVTIVPDETGIGTGGTPNSFYSKTEGAPAFFLSERHFKSLERVPHYEVSFSGTTVPGAIQLDLSHNADAAHGGTGTPYVINPLGHVKNVAWAATGTSGTDQRVIITPAYDGSIANMQDFKFYVAGGITGLSINGSVQAFDSNGDSIAGVSASISSN